MPNLVTRPFFTDNPGDLSYTYIVPGSVELEVQSIVARFDGSAAADEFIPCLSIYSQDGHLLARVRPDQVFAAGDTGVVTWGPFLKRQAAATPSSSAYEWMRRRKRAAAQQVIATGNETAVTWNSEDVSDAAFFVTVGNGIRVLQNGLYAIVCRLFWTATPGSHAIFLNGIDPDAFAGYPGAANVEAAFNNLGMVATTARLSTNQIVSVTVLHNAGANRSLWTDGSYLELRFLGDIDVTGRDA